MKFDERFEAIDDDLANRNGPMRVTVPIGWHPSASKSLHMVLVDRHGRQWLYDDDKRELVMYNDTNAVKS